VHEVPGRHFAHTKGPAHMDEDIIFIDDERNAAVTKYPGGVGVPAGNRVVTASRRPSVIIHGANRPAGGTVQTMPAATMPAQVYTPAPYFPPQFPGYPSFPQYNQFAMPYPPYGGYPYPPQASPLSRLGDISPATIVDMAARLLAALSPLPDPPNPSGKEGVDIENAITYQTALAEHAKRDEQLRELGHAIGVLLRGDLRKAG
jgi:hypothetical protein